jgi:hypothetical protein
MNDEQTRTRFETLLLPLMKDAEEISEVSGVPLGTVMSAARYSLLDPATTTLGVLRPAPARQ